jgi:hypothetical protein
VFVVVVKYLGLLAMSKILKTHPKSVQSHKDLILQCLDDKDESIRLRALDLLYGMVRGNLALGLSHHHAGCWLILDGGILYEEPHWLLWFHCFRGYGR